MCDTVVWFVAQLRKWSSGVDLFIYPTDYAVWGLSVSIESMLMHGGCSTVFWTMMPPTTVGIFSHAAEILNFKMQVYYVGIQQQLSKFTWWGGTYTSFLSVLWNSWRPWVAFQLQWATSFKNSVVGTSLLKQIVNSSAVSFMTSWNDAIIDQGALSGSTFTKRQFVHWN